jgi:2-amino-4-hydroxy-6-hydroxymethyldihydropteridine diphosphokinase
MKKVFFGIGTNLGERETNLRESIAGIEKNIGPVLKCSSLYETEPWGFKSDNQFLNMVVLAETKLSPSGVLGAILMIEAFLGRIRGDIQYASRIIDIDILLYDDTVVDEVSLKIPHPHMHERRFVLAPLCEIDPDLVHPVLKKTIASLLETCEDKSEVKKYFCPPPDSYRDPLKGG